MKATQNLENDHVYILQLIDVMERMIQHPNPEIEHLEMVVYLIRNFADGVHHAKEENLLFPLMCEKGFSKESGPVAVMLHDHVEGREFVKGMALNIEAIKRENAPTLNLVKQNMFGYINLLRAHIQKENNILFKMADQTFNEKDQEYLTSEFSKLEDGIEEKAIKNGYIAQIERLTLIYFI